MSGQMLTARYRRLTGVDALMLRMDRGSVYTHTLKIGIFDPSTDPQGWSFDRYRALVERQLPALLRQRYLTTPLAVGQPVWVDDPAFELDAHLRRVACPPPGGMVEFCHLVEQICSHPLDHGRPLWQIWAVEGLEEGRVAAVTLMHHAYSDGAGMRGILEDVSSPAPRSPSSGEAVDWHRAPLPSRLRRLAWAVGDLPPVLRALPSAVAAVRERRRLERTFVADANGGMPSAADCRRPQPFAGSLTRTRPALACDSFSLEELRVIRASLGGTVNDVFHACVAGSVRAFLAREGARRPRRRSSPRWRS